MVTAKLEKLILKLKNLLLVREDLLKRRKKKLKERKAIEKRYTLTHNHYKRNLKTCLYAYVLGSNIVISIR